MTRLRMAVAAAALMLAGMHAGSAASASRSRHIVVMTHQIDRDADYARGVQLGAREAERAAMLLGHAFRLVAAPPALAVIAPEVPPHEDAPVVAMSGTSSRACVFVTRSGGEHAAGAHATGGDTVDWHPAFRKYGASELNERFEAAFGVPMTSAGWHGWVAVKAVLEAALRGENVCDELGRLRFDGHKGRALTFDPITRQLRHPALRVTRAGGELIVEIAQ
jgi:hypothetical protein